ncbi:MAG: SagB/ThcOx family dehydrogenase [Candidatus Pacebacteria bacterium]|nr:SagB/ThcOx family dehydrogenase [Candidatus Paceibacterota bacterium]
MKKIFLYNYFHNQTNDKTEGGEVDVPLDSSLWPTEWSSTFYKKYPLARKLFLPTPQDGTFFSILQKRKSAALHKDISLDVLSYILKCGYGTVDENGTRRTAPSAGARYPLELYVLFTSKSSTAEAGFYHYAIKDHSLEVVCLVSLREEDIKKMFFEEGEIRSMYIIITAVFQRSISKYGSRGYRYLLLEAGHVGQNIIVAATEKGGTTRPLGSVDETRVEKLLGLSSEERVVYCIGL